MIPPTLWGPGQVSDEQTSSPYGEVDNLRCYIHRKTRGDLILYDPECFTPEEIANCPDFDKLYQPEPVINQDTWDNAFILIRRRIQHALDTCPDCKNTDRFIIASMAQNGPGFLGIFKGKNAHAMKLPKKDQTKDYVYDWRTFFENNLKEPNPYEAYRKYSGTLGELQRYTQTEPAFTARGWFIPYLDINYILELNALKK